MAQQEQTTKPQGESASEKQRDEDDAQQETDTIHQTVRSDVAATWWPRS